MQAVPVESAGYPHGMASRSPAFRNGDARRRAAERTAATGDQGAEARVVVELVRSGELDPIRVEVAAALGHPVAKLVEPDVKPIDHSFDTKRQAASQLAGPRVSLSWAADVIQRFRGHGSSTSVTDMVVSAARKLSKPNGKMTARRLEELSGHAHHAQEVPEAFTPLKAFMDGVYALAVGMRYGFAWDSSEVDGEPKFEWVATHAVATCGHIAACMYRDAEPIAEGEPAVKSPARDAAYLRTMVIADLRLADYLMDPAVDLSDGDGGRQWVKLREEEKAKDVALERLLDDILSDARRGKS